MKIQQKIYLAFAVIVALVIISSGVIFVNLNDFRNQFQEIVEVQLRLTTLADDIRYYDVVLTDAVRAYVIDPTNQTAYDLYFQTAETLDSALAEAERLSADEDTQAIFENIDRVNVELIAIEEQLLAAPDLAQAVSLYQGRYGDLKADYSANIISFFEQQRNVFEAREQKIVTQLNQLAVVLVVLIALIIVGSLIVARFLSQGILGPLASLINATQRISQGNWETNLPTASQDELGELARNFNVMVDQIRQTLGALEVYNLAIQTVAQVNSQISTILETGRLLQDVADLTKERFGLYHAHIYQMDDAGETLVLAAGAGHVGRQMVSEQRQIALDNRASIVATAARNRKGVSINDVRQSDTFLPHPLLPNTRSELAVPLIARGRVLGVLDVQSDQANYFDADTLGVLELLAGQVAAAISNARLYEVAERTSRHEAALSAIDAKIQSAVNMDEVLQTAVRELGKALRVPHTAIEILPADLNKNGQYAAEDSNA